MKRLWGVTYVTLSEVNQMFGCYLLGLLHMKLITNTRFSPKNIGIYGEGVVAHHLASKGHLVIVQNLRLRCGEIDILTLKNKVIYIIEVKTILQRDKRLEGDEISFIPEDNFSKTKLQKLKILRGELLCLLDSNNRSVLNDLKLESLVDLYDTEEGDLEVQIHGLAVRLYCNLRGSCISRIKVRHFLLC